MTQRRTLLALILIVGGAALGGGMQIAEPVLGLPGSISALGAPWLVCAFAVGTLFTRRPPAAAGGAVLLGLGTLLYYAALVYGYGPGSLDYATTMAVAWGAAAGVAGAAMALMGALWRHAKGRDVVLLGAVPAAALAGEAVLLTATWGDAALVLAAELMLAIVVLGLLTWRRASFHAALLVASVLTVAFAGGEAELRDMMRAAGWHGA